MSCLSGALFMAFSVCSFIVLAFAQKCQLEEVQYSDCMKSLNSKIAVNTGNKVPKADGTHRDQMLQCLKDNKCLTDNDKFVPGENEKVELCVSKAREFYKQNVVSCVQKTDPKYNITDGDTLKDSDGRKKFSSEQEFGYNKCKEKKIKLGPVKDCMKSKTPKTIPAAAAPPAGGLFDSVQSLKNIQSLVEPFKAMCDQKSKCFASISSACNQTLCSCHFADSVQKNITDTLRSCLKDAGVIRTDKQISNLGYSVKSGFQLEFCRGPVKNPCDSGSLVESISGKKQSTGLDLSKIFPGQTKSG